MQADRAAAFAFDGDATPQRGSIDRVFKERPAMFFRVRMWKGVGEVGRHGGIVGVLHQGGKVVRCEGAEGEMGHASLAITG